MPNKQDPVATTSILSQTSCTNCHRLSCDVVNELENINF